MERGRRGGVVAGALVRLTTKRRDTTSMEKPGSWHWGSALGT